ncbi:hypothetical protein AV530_014835 [Patagioenas fasciata monilis]|uniref:Uncharacterized protein n=1 Tax=Patagioenas fasciata monilis TaxID=372326 RepID=A0A1V4L0V6_PATFA|nr:hypothetical protein AV530_014835 [Patagioenas fasciata monilis]
MLRSRRSAKRAEKLKKRSKSDINREARGLGAGSRTVLPNVLKPVVNSSANLLQAPEEKQEGLINWNRNPGGVILKRQANVS